VGEGETRRWRAGEREKERYKSEYEKQQTFNIKKRLFSGAFFYDLITKLLK
jgi:hypothetical protein